MTLFKSDYEFLQSYIQHYQNLGVKHFHLYYNGKIENLCKKNKIKPIFENIMNDHSITVRFIEWDFPYWYKQEGYAIHSISQLTAITDMLYRPTGILNGHCKKYFVGLKIFFNRKLW